MPQYLMVNGIPVMFTFYSLVISFRLYELRSSLQTVLNGIDKKPVCEKEIRILSERLIKMGSLGQILRNLKNCE